MTMNQVRGFRRKGTRRKLQSYFEITSSFALVEVTQVSVPQMGTLLGNDVSVNLYQTHTSLFDARNNLSHAFTHAFSLDRWAHAWSIFVGRRIQSLHCGRAGSRLGLCLKCLVLTTPIMVFQGGRLSSSDFTMSVRRPRFNKPI